MMGQAVNLKLRHMLKIIGPGLLFASTAIGTSHLVLSTRAGAHYGMIFFWIIVGSLLFKYPFYEFSARYTNATGNTLLKGYKDQGKWAVVLFMMVIFINMFAVIGAVGAVCGGLLSLMFGMADIPMPVLVGGIFLITATILLMGRYAVLDNFIKLISVVLLLTVFTAFLAVILKGPIEPAQGFMPSMDLSQGAGLALAVSLVGFMPSGMEVSTMHSIWKVENINTTGYHPTLKESLFDFNLGYLFTTVLALMFLMIGAFTVYGSGQLLEGNSTEFSEKLMSVFTTHLGAWSYPIIALAAFGTIYGTFIATWDAFTRSFVRGLQIFKFERLENNEEQQRFLNRAYNILLPLIGLGGFLLFYQFTGGMIRILEAASIIVFIMAPIIAVLNLRAITHKTIPASHRPSKGMLLLAYAGLILMIAFSIFYLLDLLS